MISYEKRILLLVANEEVVLLIIKATVKSCVGVTLSAIIIPDKKFYNIEQSGSKTWFPHFQTGSRSRRARCRWTPSSWSRSWNSMKKSLTRKRGKRDSVWPDAAISRHLGSFSKPWALFSKPKEPNWLTSSLGDFWIVSKYLIFIL